MAERIRWLLAFFRRPDPRGAPPSGWALTLDAAVAAGAALGAVYEMMTRDLAQSVVLPASPHAVARALQEGLPLRSLVVPVGNPHASAVLLAGAALSALPLAWRRLYPIATWLVVIAAIVGVHKAYVPPVALGTAVYAAYSAVVHSRNRNLAIAAVSVTTIAAALWLGDVLPRFPGRLTAIFGIVPAAVMGLGIRELRRRLADSTARLSRAAAEASAATDRALAAERARIASELHDVVTHNVSVMIVQAGAARKIMTVSPGDAEDALLAVEATGRDAMTELRNLLGLLSPAADGSDPAPGRAGASGPAPAPVARAVPAALRPQPGLGELDTLIGRVSAAGLPVELEVTGQPQPLPPGADLAAYRVVQEALTNVLRHAGHTTATVRVGWAECLEITVSDGGRGTAPRRPESMAVFAESTAPGSGRGLLGLRERLALYGGELSAGPLRGGGWLLRAILPLPATAPVGAAARQRATAE